MPWTCKWNEQVALAISFFYNDFCNMMFCFLVILRFWDWMFCYLRNCDLRILDFGMLGFWDFEILGFWDFGILGFWDFGILRFENLWFKNLGSWDLRYCIFMNPYRECKRVILPCLWTCKWSGHIKEHFMHGFVFLKFWDFKIRNLRF